MDRHPPKTEIWSWTWTRGFSKLRSKDRRLEVLLLEGQVITLLQLFNNSKRLIQSWHHRTWTQHLSRWQTTRVQPSKTSNNTSCNNSWPIFKVCKIFSKCRNTAHSNNYLLQAPKWRRHRLSSSPPRQERSPPSTKPIDMSLCKPRASSNFQMLPTPSSKRSSTIANWTKLPQEVEALRLRQ